MSNIIRGVAFLFSGIFLFIGTYVGIILYLYVRAIGKMSFSVWAGDIFGGAILDTYSYIPILLSVLFVLMGLFFLFKRNEK